MTTTLTPSTTTGRPTQVLGWVGLVARLYLGYVFLTAGLAKLPHPYATEQAVRGYQLLPWQVVHTYALVLPAAELLIGVLLILGILTRSTAVVASLGLCSFLLGITSVWVRGIPINCGCFGGGGATTDPHYLQEVLRDSGWLAIAVFLVVLRRTRLALGDVLFGARD